MVAEVHPGNAGQKECRSGSSYTKHKSSDFLPSFVAKGTKKVSSKNLFFSFSGGYPSSSILLVINYRFIRFFVASEIHLLLCTHEKQHHLFLHVLPEENNEELTTQICFKSM